MSETHNIKDTRRQSSAARRNGIFRVVRVIGLLSATAVCQTSLAENPPAPDRITGAASAKAISECLKHARHGARTLDKRPVIQARVFLKIAEISDDPEDFEAARAAARRIRDEGENFEGVRVFAAIAGQTNDRADFDATRHAMDKIDNSWVATKGYLPLAQAFAKVGDFASAMDAATGTSRYDNLYSYAFEDIAEASIQSGEIDVARKAASKIRFPWIRARIYTDIAAVSQDPQDGEASRQAARQIIDSDVNMRGLECVRAYVTLFGVTKNTKDIESAREYARAERHPNAYTTIAAATHDPTDIAAAREAAQQCDTPSKRSRIFSSIAHVSGDPEDLAAARAAARMTEKPRERAGAFLAVFRATTDRTDLDSASQALAAVSANDPLESTLFQAIALAYARVGDVAVACDLQRKVRMHSQDRYCELARVLAEEGNLAKARDIAATIEGENAHYYRSLAFSGIVEVTKDSTDIAAARREADRITDDERYRGSAYLRLARAFAPE